MSTTDTGGSRDPKEPDVTVVTTQRGADIKAGLFGSANFDDRIDTTHDITGREALTLVIRSFFLLKEVWRLFVLKFLMAFAMVFPGLFLGWLFKIITDHVILGQPLIVEEVNFPPHMNPILRFLEGMAPMEIMFYITCIFLAGLFLIGFRVGGTGAGTYGGRDAASNAENEISSGGSGAGSIWGIVEWWVDVRLTQYIINNLRSRLFDRLTRVSITSIDDQRVGDQVYRVMYDAASVWGIVTEIVFTPFFTLLGFAITMYQLETTYADVAPWLFWLAWIMLPVVFLVTWPLNGVIRRTNQNKRAAGAASTNAMEEAMNNIGAVQSLGGMKQETEKFAQRSAHQFWRERMALVIGVFIWFFIIVFGEALGLITGYVASQHQIAGQLTAGDFFAVLALYGGIRERAGTLGGVWVRFQEHVAAVRRVFFFIDYRTEEDEDGTEEVTELGEGVEFSNVSFAYPDGRVALNSINLTLAPGELVAFVGPTGAGKTSLAYMIPGFLRATEGEVKLAGRNILDYRLDSLRGEISYVFQEHFLLSESIRDNMRFAREDATDEEIFEALETAGCMEYIDDLPEGIDTVLGRSGDTLSVGQQQRLSIARGLVRKSKILILDEPTAALDPQTENALVRALHTASEDRIVVVIAHRLSTIRQANRIVFIQDGEIRDIGDHQELMTTDGSAYRGYVELQTGDN